MSDFDRQDRVGRKVAATLSVVTRILLGYGIEIYLFVIGLPCDSITRQLCLVRISGEAKFRVGPDFVALKNRVPRFGGNCHMVPQVHGCKFMVASSWCCFRGLLSGTRYLVAP